MRNFLLYVLSLVMGVMIAGPVVAYQAAGLTDHYYDLVNKTFDKESSFETVGFVEKRWRLVGNSGFNESIAYVVEKLKKAGFKEESVAGREDRLTYRIEKRPLSQPSWEPVAGSLKLASGEQLLDFNTNRNMIAINSFSTGSELELEVVYVGAGRQLTMPDDLSGKVVFGEALARQLFQEGVKERGAAGIITYGLPAYTQPEKNQNSIQFGSIPFDENEKSFGIYLSYQAKERLKAALERGESKIRVSLNTKIYESEELTLVAELKGSKMPKERFVFSAHVQEPGANDNASGVGALTEIAASSARLLQSGAIDPERTITYLFGDEIVSTRRFIEEDAERAKDIKWGMSLDMVGENTAVTGGTFLIEKMPDPGAIWVRGVEKHSEWGGRPLTKAQLKPHYFNDLAIGVFKEIGERNKWEVKFNPFEGGSDHVPFLRADIPGLLLWHFTDQFYHTDQDRIDKVSPETLRNVGTGALMIALMLTEDKGTIADFVLEDLTDAAMNRLEAEFDLSQKELRSGSSLEKEKDIISTWADYYIECLETTKDIGRDDAAFRNKLGEKLNALRDKKEKLLNSLGQ